MASPHTEISVSKSERHPPREAGSSAGVSPPDRPRKATSGLTKKASLNSAADALDYAARLIVGFVINPLLVSGLGPVLFGVWQVLTRLIGYVSAADGRPTQALKWLLASKQASTGTDEKRRYVASAIIVWMLFVPLLAVIGGILIWLLPAFLEIPGESTGAVRLAMGILVANLIVFNLADLPRAVLRGQNLGYKRMGLSALVVLSGGALTAAALWLGFGIAGVAAATFLTTVLNASLFLNVVRKFVGWFGVLRPAVADVRAYFKLSGWFLSWRFTKQLMRASDVVLLGIFASPQLVTVYALTKYVPETLIRLVMIGVSGATPGLGGIVGQGKSRKALAIRAEIMSATWLLATVLGASVLIWNPSFVSLWVGREFDGGLLSTLLIVVMTSQFVLIQNDAQIIDLTLELKQKVQIGIGATLLSLAIAGTLVSGFGLGIAGVCAGFIIGRSILSIGYPLLVSRLLRGTFESQLRSAVRPAITSAILLTCACLISGLLDASGWLALIFSVALTVPAVALPAFFLGLPAAPRRLLVARLNRLVSDLRRRDR